MRLDKFLSLAQIGTRKRVKEYIYNGQVGVNGQTMLLPAFEIDEKRDEISYGGKRVTEIEKMYYLFHKPKGCVTAKTDPVHKTVFDYFPKIDITGLFAVGRLDKDTEGLLFITNDGEWNHRLMDPEHHVEKTYYFWAFGKITEDGMQLVQQGLDLGKGERTMPAKLSIVKEGKYSELKKQMEQDGCDAVKRNLYRQEVTAGYLTISEGKKHQVKRMMRKIGCYVVSLKRVSIGCLHLDGALYPGEYRKLTKQEIKAVLITGHDNEG